MLIRGIFLLGLLLNVLPAMGMGGIHDGGGQTVRLADGSVHLADNFPARNPSISFEPKDQNPVDIFAHNPKLKREVDLYDHLLDRYLGLLNFSNYIYLSQYREAPRYYFVKKLPDIRDCKIPRDNSGVPMGAIIQHVACTRGSVTLLLDDPNQGFQALSLDDQAALLVHEGLRRYRPRIDTFSIESIVRGTIVAVKIYHEQQRGQLRPLTDDEFAALSEMREDAGSSSISSRVDISLHFERLVQNGGGITLKNKMPESAFVGIGSHIFNSNVGANAIVLDSDVYSDIGDNVFIKNSDVHVPGVGNGSRIENSTLDLGFNKYGIGSNVLIQNSRISARPDYDSLGQTGVGFKDGSQLLNSTIYLNGGGFVLDSGSTMKDVKILLRPLHGEKNPSSVSDFDWQKFRMLKQAVVVDKNATVSGDFQPVVLFFNPSSRDQTQYHLRTMKFSKISSCPMGLDKQGSQWKWTGLRLNKLDQCQVVDVDMNYDRPIFTWAFSGEPNLENLVKTGFVFASDAITPVP